MNLPKKLTYASLAALIACSPTAEAPSATADAPSGAVATTEPDPQITTLKIDDTFSEASMGWSNSRRAGMIIRWRPIVRDGLIDICGAVQFPNVGSVTQSRRVFGLARVLYEDETIMRNLGYFARIDVADDAVWDSANCKSSGVAAPEGPYSAQLFWPRSRQRF